MAKRKLQMLSNHVFEELAMDAYDEVDRRETDAIWNGLLSKVSDVIMHELAMPKVPFINFIFSYIRFFFPQCANLPSTKHCYLERTRRVLIRQGSHLN